MDRLERGHLKRVEVWSSKDRSQLSFLIEDLDGRRVAAEFGSPPLPIKEKGWQQICNATMRLAPTPNKKVSEKKRDRGDAPSELMGEKRGDSELEGLGVRGFGAAS